MDRSSTRFIVITLALILFGAFSLAAQPPGYTEIPQLRTFPGRGFGCQISSGLYDEEKFRLLLKRPNCPAELDGLKVDFQKEALIRYSLGSDCHMRVEIKVFRSDREKKYKTIINNIYGGCRAGGWRMGWIVIEKLPPGYNMEVVEVMVDKIHGRSPDGFMFPRPPSSIKREALETREVDMKGCLPLTGQSQWVITRPHHLTSAIQHQANEQACTEYFKSLNIDFQKQTLVGYSFSTGHCDRPSGLGLEAVREISSDKRENRYVLTATFPAPGGEYCKVWTTHPVWVIVPALPEGYGFAFEAQAKPPGNLQNSSDRLESRAIDLDDCVHLYRETPQVFRDRDSYLNAIRRDASRDRCLKAAESIDFDKYSLVGLELNTGYCRTPVGLRYAVTRDDGKQHYLLSIRWTDGGMCRALSEYDMWVLVPKLPDSYGVIFDTRADPSRQP